MERMFGPEGEIAYCMGLIVGEGSFSGDDKTGWVAVKLHASDPLPLFALRNVFGGRIYGPYLHGGRHSRVWMLRGRELLHALAYFDRWLPPSRKRDQYADWKVTYARYLAKLRTFHDLHV